jgi:hypothetical protein
MSVESYCVRLEKFFANERQRNRDELARVEMATGDGLARLQVKATLRIAQTLDELLAVVKR